MRLELNTHARLAAYGRKNETYDDIINRILNIAEAEEEDNKK